MTSSRGREQIKYLRQSISLNGMGTPLFNMCVENVSQGYVILARQIARTRLAPHSIVDAYDGTPSLNFSDRYFTPKKDAPTAKSVPISKEIDPLGTLTTIAGEAFVHTEENVVHYYKRTKDADGDFR